MTIDHKVVQLIRLIHMGEPQAASALLKLCERTIRTIAYSSRVAGMSVEDVISELNAALLDYYIDQFDASRGHWFS